MCFTVHATQELQGQTDRLNNIVPDELSQFVYFIPHVVPALLVLQLLNLVCLFVQGTDLQRTRCQH